MGNEREVTEGVRRQVRMLPHKLCILDALIDMQCFFIEITNKEPTRIIMGEKQWKELAAGLDSMRMTMRPRDGFTGVLLGMSVIMEGDDRLEVTC